MKIEAQRLRNLTTGRLHTDMQCIYEDLELITGMAGLTTIALPMARRIAMPWLKSNVKDPRFWDEKYDTSHIGEVEIQTPTKEDQEEMRRSYKNEKPMKNNMLSSLREQAEKLQDKISKKNDQTSKQLIEFKDITLDELSLFLKVLSAKRFNKTISKEEKLAHNVLMRINRRFEKIERGDFNPKDPVDVFAKKLIDSSHSQT